MTCDTWHVTRDMWHVTHDMWHVTRDTRHMTYGAPRGPLRGFGEGDQWEAWDLVMWPVEKTSPMKGKVFFTGDKHTHRRTDGHRDSMTESAQWADSVKIWKLVFGMVFGQESLWELIVVFLVVQIMNLFIFNFYSIASNTPHYTLNILFCTPHTKYTEL